MGTILASALVNAVATHILNDAGMVRHKQPALLSFLNEGQRVICSLRPDANAEPLELSLVAGVHQELPPEAHVLIAPMHNGTLTAPGSAITPTQTEALDSVSPEWRAGTRRAAVKNIIYRTSLNRRFQVYPPVVQGTRICVEVGLIPFDITMEQAIVLDDTFEAPLKNYMLARAYEKTAEYAGDPQRSTMYYGLMREQLGLMGQSVVAGTAEASADQGRK